MKLMWLLWSGLNIVFKILLCSFRQCQVLSRYLDTKITHVLSVKNFSQIYIITTTCHIFYLALRLRRRRFFSCRDNEMEMKIKLCTLSAKLCLNRETNTGQKVKIVNSRRKEISSCQWRHDLLLLDICGAYLSNFKFNKWNVLIENYQEIAYFLFENKRL